MRNLLLGICVALVFSRGLLAQCPDGTPPPCRARAVTRGPAANSVAVLVFDNRARDTSLTLLAEGLADQITSNLGTVARLEVKSPASVRVVMEQGRREPQRIGQALAARWLVDGQLLPGRGNVRVSVQLVEASRGTVRWSGVYQRPLDDLFGVISAVADSVASAIVGALAPEERARMARRPTRSNEAYRAYTRGLAALRRQTEDDLRRAVAAFEDAVALDSSFAAAYAGLAEAWMWHDWFQPPGPIYARARAAAERALALDPRQPQALVALASVALYHDWLPTRAESLARQALALDSLQPRGWAYLGSALVSLGRNEEAASALHRSLSLDTLDVAVAAAATWGLTMLGRTDVAIAVTGRLRRLGLDLELQHVRARLLAGRCPDPATRFTAPVLGALCNGQPELARRQADSIMAAAERTGTYLDPWRVAVGYALLGERERALAYLERAVEARSSGCVLLAVDPIWRELRSDPRFAELVRRIGVPVPQNR